MFNTFIQIGLVGFTVIGYLLISMKMPEYGMIFNLISQIFWLYSSYRAWKDANQIGVLITTIIMASIMLYGVVNYWWLS